MEYILSRHVRRHLKHIPGTKIFGKGKYHLSPTSPYHLLHLITYFTVSVGDRGDVDDPSSVVVTTVVVICVSLPFSVSVLSLEAFDQKERLAKTGRLTIVSAETEFRRPFLRLSVAKREFA